LPTEVAKGVRGTPDVDGLATHDGRHAAVLLWDYEDAAEPAPATRVTVKVKGIPAGIRRVLVENYRIDDTHSNAYTVWKAMGSPQQPTSEQYAKLKAEEGLQLLDSPAWMDVTDDAIEVSTEMPRQSLSLLSLSW
jgi:xylan 1,4-beta-xylosidase